jgi:hypothetical protein
MGVRREKKRLASLGKRLEPPASLSGPGPPPDRGERIDREVFQASPDELPAIDIHGLWSLPTGRTHSQNLRLRNTDATTEVEQRRSMTRP